MTYQPAMPSYAHQLDGLEKMEGKPAFALLCDMGTGKTKMILDEFGRLEAAGRVRDLLVVAPAGSYRNWFEDRGPDQPSELRKHLAPSLFSRMVICGWRSGAGAAESSKLVALVGERTRPRALVVNVESQSSVEDAKILCREFLSRGEAMMVVDESTKIKNTKAKRTQAIVDLGRLAKFRRIMSGLPTPKSPLDLYAQFEFLDWKILRHRTFWSFKMRYAIIKKIVFGPKKDGQPGDKAPPQRAVDVVVGYKNVDELQRIIAPYSFRVMKEDCLDLPPKVYQRREIELTAEQRRIYDALVKTATALLSNQTYVSAESAMGQALRLHQVTSGFTVNEQKELVEIPSNRLQAVMDVLEESSGKAIVWAPYDQTIRRVSEALAKEYGPKSVARFWGGNRAERGEDERRFLTDPECRFMVSTPASGGIGNNWTVADLVIYYANSYDLEHRSQSEDRAHRAGQTKSVTYVDVVCPGTIDEKILKALRKKIDVAATVTGDGWREWIV